MADWASSGRVKIERAKEQIAEFESTIHAFFEGHPYRVVGEPDMESGKPNAVVRGGAPIPLRWSAIASDAVHNLRSSLDILWRQAMYPNGGRDSRKSFFPIYGSANKFEANRGRVVKSCRKAAMDLLQEAKPYKGGNKHLWALHAIDCRNKHEMLTLVAATYKGVNVSFPPDGGVRFVVIPTPDSGFCALKDGAILFFAVTYTADDGSEVHMDYQLTTDVAFGQGEILEGEPVVETLHEFAQVVDAIAESFLIAGIIR